MGHVITTDPFLEGGIAGDDTVQACCGVRDPRTNALLPCNERTNTLCTAAGGTSVPGSCETLRLQGKLTSAGVCFFRRCDMINQECVDGVSPTFPCPSLWCTNRIVGKCNTPTEQPCADELGACCKEHLGGSCEPLVSRLFCQNTFGIFMGAGTRCETVECVTDDPPHGCREHNERVVPPGLRHWGSDVCSGVAMEIVLDGNNDAAVMSDRMRLFGIPSRSNEDPCLQCQTAMSFGMDGDANAPFIGNAQNNDDLYHEHYKAWMVLDEHGLYGNPYDAILVGSYKTPPWAEFLFMSHGTFCKGPFE